MNHYLHYRFVMLIMQDRFFLYFSRFVLICTQQHNNSVKKNILSGAIYTTSTRYKLRSVYQFEKKEHSHVLH